MVINKFFNTALAHMGEAGNEVGFHHYGWDMMGGFGWSGVVIGWTFMVLFWALIILGIIALAKWIFSDRREYGVKEAKKIYVCAECGYEYEEKEWATKCQKWCHEHKSCNLEIISHGKPPKS